MSTKGIVIIDILTKHPSKMALAEDDDVVSALPANGADDAFADGVYLWGLSGGDNASDSHSVDASLELLSVDAVAVVDEKFRCGVVGESFHYLLAGPLRRGVRRYVEVEDLPAVVG